MIVVRPAVAADHDWIVAAAREVLGSEYQVSLRRQFTVSDGDVLVAEQDGERVGFLTWEVDGDTVETLAIGCTVRSEGVGAALMREVHRLASAGSSRLRVVTTDHNSGAQRFYRRLGYELIERRVGAVDECRRLYKPTIPADIHDEVEFGREVS